MKPLVVIPARGGSKGVPGKNIKLLGGKPLIMWTLDQVKKLYDDKIVCVSTDDENIKRIVQNSGLKVPFLRPEYLASDRASTQDVLLHAIRYYENIGYYPDVIILLQPTSPFRNSNHIREAIKLYDKNIDMIVSVKETNSNPYYILREENKNGFLIPSKKSEVTRRQDVPKVWELNGAIYLINPTSLKERKIVDFEKVIKYKMDPISSHEIDEPLDWDIAEIISKKYFLE